MKCPFCEPEIKDSVFARDGQFLAVYNVAPIFPGHSLILPEEHIHSLLELSNEQVIEMMLFARKVTTLLLKTFKAEAFDWSVQEGENAGAKIKSTIGERWSTFICILFPVIPAICPTLATGIPNFRKTRIKFLTVPSVPG